MSARSPWAFTTWLVLCVAMGPARAFAQSSAPPAGVLVVQLPFTGTATEDVLHEAEDGARNALLAHGTSGPDRSTVQSALGVTTPTDSAGIMAFGRSMGGTHVLTGRVTPLTGQYNLELHLYDIASGRMATQQRNIGEGEESTVIPDMINGLFAPGAMQPTPEEQARIAEEQRRQDEARRAEAERQRRDEEERRRAEQQRRDEAERQRRAAAEAARRVYRYAEGGPGSIGGALILGGRVSSVPMRPPSAAPAATLTVGVRLEAAYAVLASYGIEVGGSVLILGTPTEAIAAGGSARFSYPWRSYVPFRGSVGFTFGLFQDLSGSRATAAWIAGDLRGEFDLLRSLTLFAGIDVEGATDLFASVDAIAGLRVRFGGDAPSGPRPSGASGSPSPSSPSPSPDTSPAP